MGNKLERLLETKKLIESGKAGVNKKGEIVSLDENPDAIPMKEEQS